MKPRIVFMGTPEFAVPALEILIAADYPVVGVVTSTDKYGGRGNKTLLESAVKKCAVKYGIPVLQPKNLKAADFQIELRALRADLQIVVAFRMLPESVWGMPKLGTFNLHGSLLPKYRGAAPINWAVIKGETESGCTTFKIQHEIDTGDILLQHRIAIGPDDTAGDLHDRMMLEGAELVLDTVKLLEAGDYTLQAQDATQACPAPKLFRENCQIDFSAAAPAVHNFIRGLSPYPAAWTMLQNAQVKVIRSSLEVVTHHDEPGTILTDDKTFLKVAADGGYVHVKELQLAGKRRMTTEAFLRGTSLPPGATFG
ncbi:methionyl-tRNA formyltransferase [Neolewinella antarctica]|uniref:Methionyl-tRNA formyltransferase n=1 Tax=Neolewinella antarctica TaxID=442734 RepID=A0ABX0X6W7_9BACT|nr:methionyl-tRNA formyltransferase [Neolewinella antarctica]NJC24763.1 methionyl-tRNA formyltransferase [Neolewinella antarctica]